MSITTRNAAHPDADLLHDLAARTFALACPPGTKQADADAFVAANLSADAFAKYLADPARILLIGSVAGAAAGYSMLVRDPITNPDVAAVVDERTSIELSKFYVLAQNHGSGVAGALMTATLEAAAGTGAATCWLGVNQQNARAARFYGRHGFTVAGTKRLLVGDEWHDDFVMLRPLG